MDATADVTKPKADESALLDSFTGTLSHQPDEQRFTLGSLHTINSAPNSLRPPSQTGSLHTTGSYNVPVLSIMETDIDGEQSSPTPSSTTIPQSQDANLPHSLVSIDPPPNQPESAQPESNYDYNGSDGPRLEPAPDPRSLTPFQAQAPRQYNSVDNQSEMPSTSELEEQSSSPASSTRTLHLRPYQIEISRNILRGENDIIILPTGSGKTFVALNLMIAHIKKAQDSKKRCKILFTTPNRVVADQHAERVRHYIPTVTMCKLVGGYMERGTRELQKILEAEEPVIVVLTPQLIINYMLAFPGKSSLENFSLLVVDECHSAEINSQPVRRVLGLYQEALHDREPTVSMDKMRERLPQLVGMTATIGIGHEKKISAKDHIHQLCALFDMKRPPTEVVKFRDDLENSTAKPTKVIRELDGDTTNKNRFVTHVSEIIRTLLVYLRQQLISSDSITLKTLGKQVDAILSTGFKSTLARCESYMDGITAQHDYQSRTEAMNGVKVIKQIRVYTVMRYLASMSECSAALDVLINYMEEPNRGREIQFIDPYTKYVETWKTELEEMAREEDAGTGNNKLQVLKSVLKEIFERDSSSKVMIFVERRDLCRIISDWIERLNPLYRPHRFISTRDAGGLMTESMSDGEQKEVLKMFREGKLNILVSTSIGELGLDIPDCNATITYMYIKDYVSGKQVAGRSRDLQGYSYYILPRDDIHRLESFDSDEIKQNEALLALRRMEPKDFSTKTQGIMRGLQAEVDVARQQEELDRLEKPSSERILCRQCGIDLSNLANVKNYLEAGYIVVDTNLSDKLYCIHGGRDVDFVLDDMSAVGRMYCKHADCNNHLGKVYIMEGNYLPRWKLEKVKLVGLDRKVKKWDQIRKHYYIEKIGYERLRELMVTASDIDVQEPAAPIDD